MRGVEHVADLAVNVPGERAGWTPIWLAAVHIDAPEEVLDECLHARRISVMGSR